MRPRCYFVVQLPHVASLAKDRGLWVRLVMPHHDRKHFRSIRRIHHLQNTVQMADRMSNRKRSLEVFSLHVDHDQGSLHGPAFQEILYVPVILRKMLVSASLALRVRVTVVPLLSVRAQTGFENHRG
jgi:hypothetical protein